MKKRVYAFLVAVVVLFISVSGRLYFLAQSSVSTASMMQSSRSQTIAVSRGTIYDRYSMPLVNVDTQWVASVAPGRACYEAVEAVLSEHAAQAVMTRMQQGERVTVSASARFPQTDGLVQVQVPVRYPAESLATHLIGYVDGENHGVSGIEKAYDTQLGTYSGRAVVSYQTDALGHAVDAGEERVVSTIENAAGGIALTLDTQIQTLIQRVAGEELEQGAVLISDAQSGEVLGSASFPTFDRNAVEVYLEDEQSPLMDRTLATYNCGSVFKLLTAAAALEQGFSTETQYCCEGTLRVGGTVFYCHNEAGDGELTMKDAMACSCNIYFIRLALDMGKQALLSMAERAGMSSSIAIAADYTTARSRFPDETALSVKAALANVAIGQGDLLTTVYHIHQLTASIVAGGVWKEPTLYYGKVDTNGTLTPTGHQPQETVLFSEETAAVLQDMMEAVVREGTGTGASVSNGRAAGKTGTAETGWMHNGEMVVQSWFTGYYPCNEPAYIITVLSENGGVNGKTASGVFARICDALFSAGLVEKY